MLELELKVYGQVQRIGYRYSLYEFVTQNYEQVRGFVQNQPDGSVLIKAYGCVESLKKIREFAINGIDKAMIRDVEESIAPFEAQELLYQKFEILNG